MTWVLLHGFTGAPRAFDTIGTGLAGRVLAPTLPGHGPRPGAVGSFREEVERLGAWLGEEGVRDAHLVGYSFGGRLGWHLLERDDLFRRATLIGAHPGLPAPERAARREADGRWIERLEREGLEAFVAAWERAPIFASQARLPAERLAAQRAIRLSHTAAGLASALDRLGLGRMPEPPSPRVPVDLVVGGLDARHLEIARGLPHPRTVAPDVGHNVLLEDPSWLLAHLRGEGAR